MNADSSCEENIQITPPLRTAISLFLPELKHERTACVVSRGEAVLVRVGAHVLAKYGPNVHPGEADTLRFVSKSTSIPVPHVYGVYTEDDGVTFIVMQFIRGHKLLLIWNYLSNAQKQDIAEQLKPFLKELRRFVEKYIGALGKQPCRDILFEECQDRGPFLTEREMNEVVVRSNKCGWLPSESFVKSTLRCLTDNHAFVFAHGDLSPENIIVDRERVVVNAIVGWGSAGFYPEYWDFVNALSLQDWESNWVLYAQQILDPYYEEYALWYRIRELAYGV